MTLFRYNDYKIEIAPEALLIKVFKTIWNRDRSAGKEKALKELGIVYFMCDPRSSYMFYIDEKERLDVIKSDEGLPDKWKPDTHIIEAMETYKRLTETASSALLKDTREAIEKLRAELRNIDFSKTDDKGKPIYTLQGVSTAIKNVPDLVMNLTRAEQIMAQEVAEKSEMRGGKEKKIGEDGLNAIFS